MLSAGNYIKAKVKQFFIPASNELEFLGFLVAALVILVLFLDDIFPVSEFSQVGGGLIYAWLTIGVVFGFLMFKVISKINTSSAVARAIPETRQLVYRNIILGFAAFSVIAQDVSERTDGIPGTAIHFLGYFYLARSILLICQFVLDRYLEDYFWSYEKSAVHRLFKSMVSAYEKAFDDYQISYKEACATILIVLVTTAYFTSTLSTRLEQLFSTLIFISIVANIYLRWRKAATSTK